MSSEEPTDSSVYDINRIVKSSQVGKKHVIDLLEATLAINPFDTSGSTQKKKWTQVADLLKTNIGMSIGYISCKRRVETLMIILCIILVYAYI